MIFILIFKTHSTFPSPGSTDPDLSVSLYLTYGPLTTLTALHRVTPCLICLTSAELSRVSCWQYSQWHSRHHQPSSPHSHIAGFVHILTPTRFSAEMLSTTCLGLLLTSARALCFLCLTTQDILPPNSLACPHHFGCQHNYLVFQLLLFSVLHYLLRVHALCPSIKVTVLAPGGTLLGNNSSNLPLSGLEADDHHALFPVIQLAFNAPHVHLPNLYSCQFVCMETVEDSVQSFAKVMVNSLAFSPKSMTYKSMLITLHHLQH